MKRSLAGTTERLLPLLLSAVLVLGLALPVLEVEAVADFRNDQSFYMGYEKPTALILDELETNIEYPNPSEYLDCFRLSYIKSSKSETGVRYINAYTSPKATKNCMTIPDGSPVLVLACSGDFYCVVDSTQNNAGWVQSKNMDENYYGFYGPVFQDVSSELSSWRDIASLHVSQGAITGIKTDGSLVSLRYSLEGEDYTNWGKMSSMFTHGPTTYGVTADGTIRIYSDQELFYPNRTTDKLEDGTKLTDCRLVKNVKKVIGDLDTGLLCLSDGKLNYISGNGMLAERPYGFTESFLYYDANRKLWCFVDCAGVGQQLYIQNKDGSFNWDSSKDVTNRTDYQFSTLAKNITDIAGDCPFAGGFTALRKDGSLMFYGDYLTSLLVGYKEHYDMDYTFLKNYLNIDSLIDEQIYLNKEKQLVCLDDSLSKTQDKSSKEPFRGLHPDTFCRWENVVSGCYKYGALFAVDAKGRVLTDVAKDCYLDKELLEVSEWRNVVSVAVCTDMNLRVTLGVTRDGRVLCKGLDKAPLATVDATTSQNSSGESGLSNTDHGQAIHEFESEGETVYTINLKELDQKAVKKRMYAATEKVDFYGSGNLDYAVFTFMYPIEDCVFFLSPVKITLGDKKDNSDVEWSSLCLLADEPDSWYRMETFPFEDGESVYAEMYFREPSTILSFTVIPTKFSSGHSSFTIAADTADAYIGFADLAAAKRFAESITKLS